MTAPPISEAALHAAVVHFLTVALPDDALDWAEERWKPKVTASRFRHGASRCVTVALNH